MKELKNMFTEEEKAAVKEAVTLAEKRTSAEIIPAITASSGRYDRAEDIFGIVAGLAVTALAWLYFQGISLVTDDWHTYPVLTLNLFHLAVIFIAGFLAGTYAATRFPSLKLPFLMKKEMDEEIERGAAAAFHKCRVRGTAEGTGVLIYISLFEHRVRVFPDDSIKDQFSRADWEKICGVVTEGMRNGTPAKALCAAIGLCGDLLAAKFPVRAGDADELPNELHILD